MATRISTLSRAPSADWIAEHRRAWERKPALRSVYTRWFKRLRDACVPEGAIVELGCGAGFFKETYPEILATDVVENPYADRIVDATSLPFSDQEVGNILMIDVFHHLPGPERFVREVARVLRPSGRLIMIEPWIGFAGRILWTYLHHEDCDLSVRPGAPWGSGQKDPMMGNAALPYLYFRPGGHLETMGLPLRVIRRDPFTALPWLLSGGFQPLSLLPSFLAGTAEMVDRVLSLAPSLTATRCLVTVERTA